MVMKANDPFFSHKQEDWHVLDLEVGRQASNIAIVEGESPLIAIQKKTPSKRKGKGVVKSGSTMALEIE